jgi:hypothetical protein
MANIGSNTLIWNSLLSETQYATELTVFGLRTLCQVPVPDDLFMTDEESVRYKLHVGLHAYTSGLERLGKLAFSCQTYLDKGSFPPVKSLSHKLEKISEKIEALDFSSSSNLFPEYLPRPAREHSKDLFILLDGFAAGSGRYEYLDSLSNETQAPDTYIQWKELSELVSNGPRIDLLLSLSAAIENSAFSRISDDQHFLVSELLNSRSDPFLPKSTAVSEILFEYARWFAASLSSASSEAFYGRKLGVIPYLSEVLDRHFLHKWDSFFEFHVAQFGDAETLMEGLSENSSENLLQGPDNDDF